MKQGSGCAAHYAVEVPKEKGGPDLTNGSAGYYETGYSINPHWTAKFKQIAEHPVTTRREAVFDRDEWYYNIRFPEGQRASSRCLGRAARRRRGHARRQDTSGPERGGGLGSRAARRRARFRLHRRPQHTNWGNDDFRKLVLNAMLWTAKVDVPPRACNRACAPEELKQNLDKKKK